ncbi:MAG: carboxypeptidase regulatory-like domain-containing protein, partial [Gemmatimonadales bacterium]|nr:carboxypeptidase regulatory-like domain-containing protein [Gemmatimonadales bacterium]
MSRRLLVGLAVAALFAEVAAPAAAQRISGTVRETDGGRPIAGGFISLLNTEGEAVEADFTAADGIFSFTAPGPGRYRIRVERIGYANWVTEAYDVTAGQPLTITVEVPPDPVRLGDLRVEVTGSCLDDPSEGVALATVWDEARKALETAVWAEGQGELTFTLREYRRTLDPRHLTTLETESRTRPHVRLPPFRSLPARQLTTSGYARLDA